MPIAMAQEMESSIAEFRSCVAARLGDFIKVATPEGFRAVELGLHELARQLADALSASILRERVRDPFFSADCVAAARSTGRYRSNGRRPVEVTLLGGTTHSVVGAYMPVRRGPSRRRCAPALVPALAALGCWWGTSPALADEVSRQVTESCSLRDALESLARRGIKLEYKRTLRLVQSFSGRAVAQRRAWLRRVFREPLPSGSLRGRTVMVSIDGGRLRERCVKRGHRRANGHHRYAAPWREPRQLVITVLDDHGKPDRRVRPLYDATLGDADDLFMLLWAYLRALGAHEAERLVFVADGAPWIWRRVPLLALAVGLYDRLVQVIDYSHAVGTLNTIASACAGWSETRRHAWVRRVERQLYQGDVAAVCAAIRDLAVGRRAKAVLSHLPYFEENAPRMQYPTLRASRLPQGSGIVESAIRRVVNLRLKSAGKFWLHDNAEGMLHLRSYLKAGRWDQLVRRTLDAAVPWVDSHATFVAMEAT
jgi:hypothetical protein